MSSRAERRIGLACAALAATSLAARAQTCGTEQLLGPGGVAADGNSQRPRISADGRYVLFPSYATVFVPGVPPPQAYLFDRATGAYEVISRNSSGHPATYANSEGVSEPIDISSDGRFVTFVSKAINLVANDLNASADLFLRDRVLGTTIAIATSAGATVPTGSAGGAMNADATKLVFNTGAALVPSDTNGWWDVYCYDRLGGTVSLASVASNGSPADNSSSEPDLSADGRYLVFETFATNLVPGDTNGVPDIVLRDLLARTNERISVASGGAQLNFACFDPHVSADGRFVAFSSFASTYLRDRALDTTVLVNLTPAGTLSLGGASLVEDLSGDGRFVAFMSQAGDLVAGDTNDKVDVFVRDMWTATTSLVSATPSGGVSNAHSSGGAALSADGRVIAFASKSPNLTQPPISNGYQDVFVRECTPNGPSVYCIAQVTSNGCVPSIGSSGTPSASSGAGFDVAATNVLNQKSGTLFYGTNGSNLVPFKAGWMCVRAPMRRTGLQTSDGNPPPDDCSGSFHFDFNAWIASGADATLTAGTEVWCQYWSRDGAAAFQTNLSDALAFTITP